MANSTITVTLDASKIKAILDLAKEYCKDNLVELIKEWQAMQNGQGRGPRMDELVSIVRDYWPVHALALAGDLIRNAAFERVLWQPDHRTGESPVQDFGVNHGRR